jgi:uncharacterized protein (UPF0305 family)
MQWLNQKNFAIFAKYVFYNRVVSYTFFQLRRKSTWLKPTQLQFIIAKPVYPIGCKFPMIGTFSTPQKTMVWNCPFLVAMELVLPVL